MTDQLTIYDTTLACHQAFQSVGAVPILGEWAENCIADLNLWAAAAGALRVGKASLDARLSSNLDARDFVINLLRMLQGFVEECVEIGSKLHSVTPETTELSQAIHDVNDIMGQLSRVTSSIRKAGTNARIQKADASYDPNHPQIKALSQHLQLLLLIKPSENGTWQARASPQGILVLSCRDDTLMIDSNSLNPIQQRLIEANLKRRNRFLYAQRHALKLSKKDYVTSTSIPAPRQLALPPVVNAPKGIEGHEVPRVYSATTATEVQDPIALPAQASAQPATTVISAISSRVTYPKPPPIRSDQNVFQCPCCCQTLSTTIGKGSQWKKHLSRDILPYTCILEHCPYPEKLYDTKNLWLSHMCTDHGGSLYWVCLACNDSRARLVFYEKSALIEHLEERHSGGIKPHQRPMLASAWQRETSVSIHSCPLCGFEDQDSIAVLNHTAEHLHSFSLRSLPWAPGEAECDNDLYDEYYEEHPYFNAGRSFGTESGRSRSTMASEQWDLEDLPAIGPDGETTETNRLTEEKIRNISGNPKSDTDILDAFLKGIEHQKSLKEPFAPASDGNLVSVLDDQSQYEVVRIATEGDVPDWLSEGPKAEKDWNLEVQTLVGHSGQVWSAAFSPDGRRLATGSSDQTIKLWDPATGTELQTLVGHSDVVQSLAFSPDGCLLSSGSSDQTIKLWDPATGLQLRTLVGHSDLVQSLAFSPDGCLLASGSSDQTIKLWDPTTGAELQTLVGHSNWVFSVTFSPDGRLLASGSSDRTIKLWDPATGACEHTIEGHSGLVQSVVFSPDGRLLASGSSDQTIKLWEPTTGAVLQTLMDHPKWVLCVAFSPDGCLLSGSGDGTIELWDPTTGACQHLIEGYSDLVQLVAFSPDGCLLASGSGDRTIKLWNIATSALPKIRMNRAGSLKCAV